MGWMMMDDSMGWMMMDDSMGWMMMDDSMGWLMMHDGMGWLTQNIWDIPLYIFHRSMQQKIGLLPTHGSYGVSSQRGNPLSSMPGILLQLPQLNLKTETKSFKDIVIRYKNYLGNINI
ncbi:hypothetical protein AVEN_108780-1 [Araneus ventricosus]|uniref:Uncharacterized protein n=1 Tax=Araneus ventricosus TaxID=182803 RepID=A0A4Y2GA10_ARAVE|nr:hypothetical protein AVEN_108780-1 [Araneus ventricosus]